MGGACHPRRAESLCLRPLSGAEADVQLLRPELERDPVRPARFDLPDSGVLATQDAARILADALRLSMRRGAGPFRSAARLAFEPRRLPVGSSPDGAAPAHGPPDDR